MLSPDSGNAFLDRRFGQNAMTIDLGDPLFPACNGLNQQQFGFGAFGRHRLRNPVSMAQGTWQIEQTALFYG